MIVWPYDLTPKTISAQPAARNARGSTSLSGVSQTIGSRMAVWRVRYEDFSVLPDRVKTWRALQAKLQGSLNPVVIPVWEQYRIPGDGTERDIWSYPDRGLRVPFDDGAFFDDGTGFYEPTIAATLTSDVARGAVAASIDMEGAVLEEGNFFSIGVRLYIVKDILSQSGDVYSIKFWPTAREAASAGDPVEFDRPQVKVRLAKDDAMDIALEMNRFGSASVDFIEDLS